MLAPLGVTETAFPVLTDTLAEAVPVVWVPVPVTLRLPLPAWPTAYAAMTVVVSPAFRYRVAGVTLAHVTGAAPPQLKL